ncbi:DUF962 domain-containing protein [Leucothrix sargassi]|nr:DUF962 domain-containing protein [Leucothrix sargassi]
MKSFDEWMSLYAVSHQDPLNKKIHNICVPVIFFTVVALLWKLSIILFLLVSIGAIGFYFTLGKKVATLGASMIGISLVLQLLLNFGYIALIVIFAIAWAGQFYGHKVEGKKPSFLEDLSFLLIGPLWVSYPLLKKYGYNISN